MADQSYNKVHLYPLNRQSLYFIFWSLFPKKISQRLMHIFWYDLHKYIFQISDPDRFFFRFLSWKFLIYYSKFGRHTADCWSRYTSYKFLCVKTHDIRLPQVTGARQQVSAERSLSNMSLHIYRLITRIST